MESERLSIKGLIEALSTAGVSVTGGAIKNDVHRGFLPSSKGTALGYPPEMLERAKRLYLLRERGVEGDLLHILLFLSDGLMWDNVKCICQSGLTRLEGIKHRPVGRPSTRKNAKVLPIMERLEQDYNLLKSDTDNQILDRLLRSDAPPLEILLQPEIASFIWRRFYLRYELFNRGTPAIDDFTKEDVEQARNIFNITIPGKRTWNPLTVEPAVYHALSSKLRNLQLRPSAAHYLAITFTTVCGYVHAVREIIELSNPFIQTQYGSLLEDERGEIDNLIEFILNFPDASLAAPHLSRQTVKDFIRAIKKNQGRYSIKAQRVILGMYDVYWKRIMKEGGYLRSQGKLRS